MIKAEVGGCASSERSSEAGLARSDRLRAAAQVDELDCGRPSLSELILGLLYSRRV